MNTFLAMYNICEYIELSRVEHLSSFKPIIPYKQKGFITLGVGTRECLYLWERQREGDNNIGGEVGEKGERNERKW